MLAHIMSEATSTRARRFATYTATTIGGAWLVGKYAVNMLARGAESSRKEAAEKHEWVLSRLRYRDETQG